MAYSVEPLTQDNAGAAVEALIAAFMDDPLFVFTIPNGRHRAAWLPHLWRELIKQTMDGGRSRVVLDEHGDVAGAMCAGPYPPKTMAAVRMNIRLFFCPLPWVPSFGPFMAMFTYQRIWEKMHYKGPHDFVYTIGIHPDHQRRGLGRKLMHTLIAYSHESGRPIYLETQTESNVPFYASLGFDLTEEHAPFENGPHTWGFFRPAGRPPSVHPAG